MSCKLRNVYSYDWHYFKNALSVVYKDPSLKYELERKLARIHNREKTRTFSDLLQFMKNGLGLIDYRDENSKVLLTPRGLRTIIAYILKDFRNFTDLEVIDRYYFRYATWINLLDIDYQCIMDNIQEHLKRKSQLFRDEHRRDFHYKALQTVFGPKLDFVKEIVKKNKIIKLNPYDKDFDYSLIFQDTSYNEAKTISKDVLKESINHHLAIQSKVYSSTTLFLNVNVLKGIIQTVEIARHSNFLNEMSLEKWILREYRNGKIELARGAGTIIQEGRGVILHGDHFIYYTPKMI